MFALIAGVVTAVPRASGHGTHTIDVADVTVAEGDTSGAVDVELTVSPAPAVGELVTVGFATADGTATASDYAPTSGTATFGPGGTATVRVTVHGDSSFENNETFFLNLSDARSNAGTATIADAQGQILLVNDDSPPVVSISGRSSVGEGNGGMTPVTYTVALRPPSGLPATVAYTTTDATASAPGDYQAQAGTLTFVPGETAKAVTVQVVGDAVFEPDEGFSVDLSTPSNATLGRASSATTIANDDTPATPQFSISDASMREGDAGFTTFTFKVALSHTVPATVRVATADGTAQRPGDYVASAQTLTFAVAETQDFSVQVVGDTVPEGTETFFVDLSSPACSGCAAPTFADAQGEGTIVNDDGVADQPENQIDVNDASAGEGSAAVFTVSRGSPCPPATSVEIRFDTRSFADGQPSGTAAEGTDYSRMPGSVVLGAGQSSATFSVSTIADDIEESDETFSVFLGAPTGTCTSSIDDGQGAGTIVDDDSTTPPPPPPPAGDLVITGGRRVVNERNFGTRSCRVPVSLSRAPTQTVTVRFTTRDSTATAGEDYVSTSGTLTFAPGAATTQKATITVHGDTRRERPRRQRVLLDLTDPTGGASIGKSPAKCVIRDERSG